MDIDFTSYKSVTVTQNGKELTNIEKSGEIIYRLNIDAQGYEVLAASFETN